ncbi:MAG: HK97 gp10 family phage protein [Candidatus Dormibacteria bacterium]
MALESVIVTGVEEFAGRLAGASARVHELNRAAMVRATKIVEAAAKSRVPRRTGRLFGSIDGHLKSEGEEIIGEVSARTVYARAVEYGFPAGFAINYRSGRAVPGGGRTAPYVAHSRGRAARGYLIPGLNESKTEIYAEFRRAGEALLHELKG